MPQRQLAPFDDDCFRRRLGLGLVERNGLGGLHARPSRSQLGIEFADPLAQVGILLDQAGQPVSTRSRKASTSSSLYPRLPIGRLTERHIVHVSRCQWHRVPFRSWDGGLNSGY